MKRIMMAILLSVSPVSMAGYTYVVTDGVMGFGSLWDHESLLMTGGGGDSLSLNEWSTALITGTSPYSEYPTGGIRALHLVDNSRLEFSGGEVRDFSISAQGMAVFKGGTIGNIYSFQDAWKYEGQPQVLVPNPHIEMVVRDWLYNPINMRLTGTWGDSSTFNIKLIDVQGYSPTIENIQFTIIPEPMTMLLLGIGGLLVRQKRVIG